MKLHEWQDFQQKSPGPESFMRGSTRHMDRWYLSFSNHPKNRRGGNTPQFLLWGHNYLDTKIRQTLQEKKQLQVSIYDEHRSENPQKNISKQNSTIKKDHGEFSGGQVIRTLRFHCWGWRFNPCRGIKIPQAMKYGKKKKKSMVKLDFCLFQGHKVASTPANRLV